MSSRSTGNIQRERHKRGKREMSRRQEMKWEKERGMPWERVRDGFFFLCIFALLLLAV
jgi:hypothetical protein